MYGNTLRGDVIEFTDVEREPKASDLYSLNDDRIKRAVSNKARSNRIITVCRKRGFSGLKEITLE